MPLVFLPLSVLNGKGEPLEICTITVEDMGYIVSFRHVSQQESLVGDLFSFEKLNVSEDQSLVATPPWVGFLDSPPLVEPALGSAGLECITSSMTCSSSIIDRWRTAKYLA